MKTIKKEDISQEVFDFYEDYAHDKLTRRQFVEKLSLCTVGGLTVGSLLSCMSPDYVTTLLISKDDPRVTPDYISYDSPKNGGNIKALL